MNNSNADDRDTLPPTAPFSEAPPPMETDHISSHGPVAKRVSSFDEPQPEKRPNPNSWTDVQLMTIVEGMQELKRARAAFDPEALLNACVTRIERVVAANSALMVGQLETERARTTANSTEIKELRAQIEALGLRIDMLEKQENLVGDLKP